MESDRPRKILQAAARDASARARLLAEALDALADAAGLEPEHTPDTSRDHVAALRVSEVGEASSDKLWRVADVAEFLDASESWVRHAAAGGRLPVTKIGGLLRFHPDEIRSLIRVEPPAAVLPRRKR